MAARRKTQRRRTKAYREFVSEAEEILERMRDDLSDLADRRGQGADVDPELVNRLFRSAHSLKGLSGMFGLDGVSELSHHLEDVLDGLRMGRTVIDDRALTLLDESVALVGQTLEKLEEGEGGGLDDQAAELIARIDTWARAPEAEAGGEGELDLEPSMQRALTEYEEHRLRENVRRGRRIVVVEASFDILSFEEGLAELTGAIREVGEVLSTLPSPGESPESQIRFSLLVATELARGRPGDAPRAGAEAVRSASRAAGEPARTRNEAAGLAEEAAPAAEAAPAPTRSEEVDGDAEAASGDAESLAGAELGSLKSISETVRVDIRKLDELMNLVGELVIQRSALAKLARQLRQEPGTARIGAELEKIHKGLERKLQELQAGVLEVRMVPLAPGVREALPRGAAPAPRHRQGGAPRDPRRRHRARQADRRGAGRPADARGAERLRPRHRGGRRAPRRRQAPRGLDPARGLPARQRRRDRGDRRRRAASTPRRSSSRAIERGVVDAGDAALAPGDPRPRVRAGPLHAQRGHRDQRARRRHGRGARQHHGAAAASSTSPPRRAGARPSP